MNYKVMLITASALLFPVSHFATAGIGSEMAPARSSAGTDFKRNSVTETQTVETPSFIANFRVKPGVEIAKLVQDNYEKIPDDPDQFLAAVDDLRKAHYLDDTIELEILPTFSSEATGVLLLERHVIWNMSVEFMGYRQHWLKARGVYTFIRAPDNKDAGSVKIQHRWDWDPQILSWVTQVGHGYARLRYAITDSVAGDERYYGSKVICESVNNCVFDWIVFYPR